LWVAGRMWFVLSFPDHMFFGTPCWGPFSFRESALRVPNVRVDGPLRGQIIFLGFLPLLAHATFAAEEKRRGTPPTRQQGDREVITGPPESVLPDILGVLQPFSKPTPSCISRAPKINMEREPSPRSFPPTPVIIGLVVWYRVPLYAPPPCSRADQETGPSPHAGLVPVPEVVDRAVPAQTPPMSPHRCTCSSKNRTYEVLDVLLGPSFFHFQESPSRGPSVFTRIPAS